MDVFDLVAKLTLDSSEYDAGLDGAGSKASGFASKLGGGLATAAKVSAAGLMAAAGAGIAVAGAFVKGTAAVAAYGDNIDKMSQKMGMSATAYQEWDAVMRHSGTSMETLKASMKTLASAAETGKDAFDKLGISQQQIASMSQEELFSATITALQGVTDETERTYLAGQLLGRGATELGALLNTSAADTQAMKDRVHELGGVMSDESVKAAARFQDSLQDMQTAIDGAKRSLAEGFLPAIADIMDGIGNVVSGFDVEGGLEQIEQGVDNFINNLSNVIPRVAEMAGRIIPAFAKAIATNLPTLAQTGLDLILHLGQGIANAIPSLIARLPAIIVGIVNFITSNLPAIVQTGVQIIVGIIQGLAQAIPQLISYAPQIIMAIAQGIWASVQILWENGPAIIQAIGQGVLNGLSALGELGLRIVMAIGEGILNALGWLGDAIVSLFSGGLSAGDKAASQYRSLGEHAATETTEGYRSGSGSFSSAVSESVSQGKSIADAEASGFTGSGGSAASNWLSGWSSGSGSFSGGVGSAMSGAVKTAEGWAPQFSAPAESAVSNLTNPFLSGGGEIAGGVNSAMGSALSAGEAGAVQFGQVGSSMISQTTSSIAAAAPAVSSAARGVVVTAFTVANAATSMFSSVGAQMAAGIARGVMAAAGQVASAAASVVRTALAAAKAAAAIASPSKKFRDEVGVFMGLGVAEGLEKSEDKAVQAAVRLAQDTYSKAAEWLRRNAKFNKWTLEEQLSVWQEIQAGFVKGSKQYLDAEEEIFDLREKMSDEYYNNEKKRIQKHIKYQKLSKLDQIAAWRELRDQYEKNSQEYAEIDETIYDLREDVAEDFRDKVKDIWKDIGKTYETYTDTLQNRVKEIASSYGLFDDVQDRYKLSSQELMMNLQRQVNVMTSFYEELDQLSARGMSDELVQEIRDMGPKAVDQLDALLAMTDEQLAKYADLYEQKQALANTTALKELDGLRKETAEEIKSQLKELDKLYGENSGELGGTFVDTVAKGIKENMGEVARAAMALANEANRAFYAGLDSRLSGGLGSSKVTQRVSFAKSALGNASAQVVNTIASQPAGQGGVYSINLVTPNGDKLASYMFNPLKNYAASKGKPITATG